MLAGAVGAGLGATGGPGCALLGLAGGVLVARAERANARNADALYALARGVALDAAALEPVPGAPDIVVIVPAFDEAENLPELLARAPDAVAGRTVRVLVVDDGSRDRTAVVAREAGARVARSPVNGGGGHALQIGFEAARRLGARFAVTMDADGQHRFEDLATVLGPLLRGEADVVVGSRNLGESVGHTAFRALGLRVFNVVIGALTGRPTTDCSSGFRAIGLEAARPLRLRQRRHHTAELLLEAARHRLRVVEVPITILPRAHGASKKGPDLLYGLRFAGTILTTWWGG